MNAKHIRMLALFPLLALGAAASAVAADTDRFVWHLPKFSTAVFLLE